MSAAKPWIKLLKLSRIIKFPLTEFGVQTSEWNKKFLFAPQGYPLTPLTPNFYYLFFYFRSASQWGLNPVFQYCPVGDKDRAKQPDNDTRSRFTALFSCSSAGNLGPTAAIIKCSTDDADQTGIRVISTLHSKPGYTQADGWVEKIWKGKVSTKSLGEKEYTRPYLIHKDGRIIWAQSKAYMDSCGMCMWIDLLFGPLKLRSGASKWLLVWDSCRSHLTESVSECFKKWGILVEQLPPNMTDVLQVIDLVVNGPIKRRVRRERASILYKYMRHWRIKAMEAKSAWDAKALSSRKDECMPLELPPYTPPPPDMIQGLTTIFSTVEDFNQSDSFKSGISKCFRDIGLAPINSRGDFVHYPSTHSKSKISIGKDVQEKKGHFNPYAILLHDDFAFEHKTWNDGVADALLVDSADPDEEQWGEGMGEGGEGEEEEEEEEGEEGGEEEDGEDGEDGEGEEGEDGEDLG
jgi:hypothetical protein